MNFSSLINKFSEQTTVPILIPTIPNLYLFYILRQKTKTKTYVSVHFLSNLVALLSMSIVLSYPSMFSSRLETPFVASN